MTVIKKKKNKLWIEEILVHFTYSAQLTTANEDAALVQHTGVEMQHVVDINCYKILRQISLGRDKNHFWLMRLQNQVSLTKKKTPKPKRFHPSIVLHPVWSLTKESRISSYGRGLSNCSISPQSFGELGLGVIKVTMFHTQPSEYNILLWEKKMFCHFYGDFKAAW